MKKYKICDLVLKMNPQYNPTIIQSEAYITFEDLEVDFEIPNIEDKIELFHGENPHLTIGSAEYILYGSYFYTKLIAYEGIMLHSSAVVYEDKAYLFSANSGVGKSTHTSLWTQVFKEAYILNDDKPAIRLQADKLYAYGTPFSGKTDLNVNKKKPIQAICFIERSAENWIERIDVKEAINNIFSQTVRPSRKELVNEMLNIIEKIVMTIPIYKMGLNISEEAVLLAYNTMKEGKTK